MNEADRERPTDPITHEPPSAPNAAPFHAMPPAARVPEPDPNSFSELAMQAILDGMAELKLSRKAFDADALLARETEVFAQIVTDRYEMIRGPLVDIRAKLEQLVTRVDKHDTRLESGDERFERIEFELATMKTQMDRLEQMRSHITALETELAKLREGQQSAAADLAKLQEGQQNAAGQESATTQGPTTG